MIYFILVCCLLYLLWFWFYCSMFLRCFWWFSLWGFEWTLCRELSHWLFGLNDGDNSGWWFGIVFIFPYIGNNHPNWLIFFRGVETTNQNCLILFRLLCFMWGFVTVCSVSQEVLTTSFFETIRPPNMSLGTYHLMSFYPNIFKDKSPYVIETWCPAIWYLMERSKEWMRTSLKNAALTPSTVHSNPQSVHQIEVPWNLWRQTFKIPSKETLNTLQVSPTADAPFHPNPIYQNIIKPAFVCWRDASVENCHNLTPWCL